jgi:hypothetical protein
MAGRGGRAVGQACTHAVQMRSGNERCEGHAKGEILSVRRRRMVSWTEEDIQASTRRNEKR